MIFGFAGMAGAFAALRHSKHDGKHCQSSKERLRSSTSLAAAKRSEDGSSESQNNLLPFRTGVDV